MSVQAGGESPVLELDDVTLWYAAGGAAGHATHTAQGAAGHPAGARGAAALQAKPAAQDPARHAAFTSLSLRVWPGELVAVTGASGTGKSSLCRLVTGLIPGLYPADVSGSVRVVGRSPLECEPSDLFGPVACAFEDPDAQFFRGSVTEEIAYGLESLGIAREQIAQRVADAASRFSVDGLLDRDPHELSAGQKRRVLLVAVTAVTPSLLVLDEPFSGLDSDGIAGVRAAIAEARRAGAAVLLCVHEAGELAGEANRIVEVDAASQALAAQRESDLQRGSAGEHGSAVQRGSAVQHRCGRQNESAGAAALRGVHGERPSLEADGVCVNRGGRRVLDGVSLSVSGGECLALTGANGSGKTTLLRTLAGLQPVKAGGVRLMGSTVGSFGVSELAQVRGFAVQRADDQLQAATVLEEIRTGPELLGCLDEVWIGWLVDALDLEHLLGSAPQRLSRGQRRRVGLAVALAARPPIVLLDEPTAGQDRGHADRIISLIERLRDAGHVIVVATHDEALVERCCSGRLALDDSVDSESAHELSGEGLRQKPVGEVRTRILRESEPAGIDPRAGMVVAAAGAGLAIGLPEGAFLTAYLVAIVMVHIVTGSWRAYGKWLVRLLPIIAVWTVIRWVGADFEAGVQAGVRLAAVASVFYTFFRVYGSAAPADSLEQSGLSHSAAFTVRAGMAMAPVLARRARAVVEAQRLRGVPLEAGFGLVRHGPRLAVPLLVESFRLADRLSEAMETRGFERSGRTWLLRYRFGAADGAAAVIAVMSVVAILFWV